MSARVTDVRTEPFSVGLERPLSTARGTIDCREGLLVRLTLDGEPGVGEATPLPGWTESLAACTQSLETACALTEREGLEAALETLTDHPAARHGLELAGLDARARSAGRPLYQELARTGGIAGPDTVERVPVNATVGASDVEATVRATERAVAAGFSAVKVKVGVQSVAEDAERMRAARAACPDVELRADANGAWSRSEAREALSAFATTGVRLVEQPLAPDDLAGHAALSGGPVAVGLDESLACYPVETVIRDAAPDVLVLKPMVLGGVGRARTAALAARDAGLDVVVTTTIDAAPARTAAVHLTASLPGMPACGLATGERLADDLVPDPSPVTDGTAAVPQGKGNIGCVPRPEDA